jgi:hypothetical protein
MLFNCLSASTGMWLLMTPLLWPDQPARAIVAGLAGLAVMVLAPMGVAAPRLNRGIAWLGGALGLLNFFLPGDIGSMANFATSGFLLILGGMAPMPRVALPMAAALPATREVVPARSAGLSRPLAA